jgi:hypothetical protein
MRAWCHGHRQPGQGLDRRRHQSFTVDTNDQILSAEPWNDVVLAYETARRSACATSAGP